MSRSRSCLWSATSENKPVNGDRSRKYLDRDVQLVFPSVRIDSPLKKLEGLFLRMTDIELALHQGPACLGRHIRRNWPKVEVAVEFIETFEKGVNYETLRVEGDDVGAVLEEITHRYADYGASVLEQEKGFARLRLKIHACPLLSLFVQGELVPRFPFKVERDSDRWVLPDRPESLEKALLVLWDHGIPPKMVRRDPSRRP